MTRKALTNHDLLARYERQKEAAQKKLTRTIQKSIRVARTLQLYYQEVNTLTRRIQETFSCLERGEVYRPVKEPKRKKGRQIELD